MTNTHKPTPEADRGDILREHRAQSIEVDVCQRRRHLALRLADRLSAARKDLRSTRKTTPTPRIEPDDLRPNVPPRMMA